MKIALLALTGLGATWGGVTSARAQTPPAAASAPAPAAGAPELKTPEQKTAYALGMELSQQVKPAVGEYDANLLAQGFRDGLLGKPALTEAQFVEAMEPFKQKMMARQREAMARQQGAGGGANAAEAEKNLKAGQAFLAANKAKPGITTLPSGVQYKVLKQGTGPTPKASDVVEVNYRGTFIDGTEFDASAKHGGTATFPANEVIAGWTEVLQKMKTGDKFQVFIPSDSAYGPGGRGEIPPNSTLIFEIELLKIVTR